MANPREEQYEAAIEEAREIVRRESQRTIALEPDREEVPHEVRRWMQRYAENLPRLRACCPQSGMSQVRIIFGPEPNRAYCLRRCAKRRADMFHRAIRGRTRMDCDFCGHHYPVDDLIPVVFNVAAVVVRAASCFLCLGEVPTTGYAVDRPGGGS